MGADPTQALPNADRDRLAIALAGMRGDAQVDLVRCDMRDRWASGHRLPVEVYLELPALTDAGEEVVLDLIYSEIMLREEVDGDPNLETVAARFPAFADRLRRLHAMDAALGFQDLSIGRTLTVARPNAVPEIDESVKRIGRYPILCKLDEGGQAVVYRAIHPTLGREVILKWSKRPL